jgi:hypothetical protein
MVPPTGRKVDGVYTSVAATLDWPTKTGVGARVKELKVTDV